MAPGNLWITINLTVHPVWSSLTGLMIQQLPTADNSTFTLESSYIDLACSNNTRIKADSPNKTYHPPPGSFKTYFKTGLRYHNTSSPYTSFALNLPRNGSSSFFMDSSYPVYPHFKRPPNLLCASNLGFQDGYEEYLNLFNCTVAIARVESEIICHGGHCAVTRLRRSEMDTLKKKVVLARIYILPHVTAGCFRGQ